MWHAKKLLFIMELILSFFFQPDSTQFCETNYKLEWDWSLFFLLSFLFRYSDVSPPNWSDAFVTCPTNQYKINQGGTITSTVPIGFRCVKESEFHSRIRDINYNQEVVIYPTTKSPLVRMITNVSRLDERETSQWTNIYLQPKNENNELKCDPEYELQTKWIVSSIQFT